MSAYQIPAGVGLILIIVIVGSLFWPFHIIQIKKPYVCSNGKHWSTSDPLVQFWVISINTAHFDCPVKERYDPTLYKPLSSFPVDKLPDVSN
jgi:hypothetical protein